MKKFFISLLILITGAVCFAESDLQISTQPFSLYQYKYITWDNLKYMESLGFQYSGNVLGITNHNYLWKNRFGFYEAINFFVDTTFGINLAAGPCFKIYENDNILLTAGAGVHSTFYTPEHIEFGLESDFSVKFFKKKRFSPVLGLRLDFDFLTNGKSDDVVHVYINALVNNTASNVVEAQKTPETQWVDWAVSIDKSVKQFFAFYVKPYIGCTWNF